MNEASNYMLGKCGSENRSDVVMLKYFTSRRSYFVLSFFVSYHSFSGFLIKNRLHSCSVKMGGKGLNKVIKRHCGGIFMSFLPSFLHSLHFSGPPFSPFQTHRENLHFIIWLFFPPPVFSAPCRIQWHSFLMRLLSLLISVSSGKVNDSRPCNKYNMCRINFSENKNERLPLLYPFSNV